MTLQVAVFEKANWRNKTLATVNSMDRDFIMSVHADTVGVHV